MSRSHIAGAALLFISLLPGCGIFANRPGLCNRCKDRDDQVYASPVSFPMNQGIPGDPGCGGSVIPPGAIYGAPGAGPGSFNPTETFPPPESMPNIPKAKIDEGPKGKQFDPDLMGRGSGPVLTMPAVGSK